MLGKKFKYKKGGEYLFENIPNIDYIDRNFDTKNIYYIIEEPNKIFIYFFGIE